MFELIFFFSDLRLNFFEDWFFIDVVDGLVIEFESFLFLVGFFIIMFLFMLKLDFDF